MVKNKVLVFGIDNWLDEYDLLTKEWRKISIGLKSHIPIKDINNFSFASPSLYVEYDSKLTKLNKQENKNQDQIYVFGNDIQPCILQIKEQKANKQKYKI